MNSLN